MIVCPHLVVFREQISLAINLIIAFHPARSRPGTAKQKNVLVWDILSHLDVGYLVKYVVLSKIPSVQVDIAFCITVGVGSVREVTATNVDSSNVIFWTFFRVVGLKGKKSQSVNKDFRSKILSNGKQTVTVYTLIRFCCDSNESFAMFIPAASVKAPPNP